MTSAIPDIHPRLDAEGRLIGHDGALYPRLAWPSALERRLTLATRFPARARRIAAAFERWLSPERASEAERAELGRWVVQVAPHLGSAAIDHAGELVARHPALAPFAAREAAALAGFLGDVLDAPSRDPAAPSGARPGRRRVVVFYSDLGGGTRSVAGAVAELLRETEDFEPLLFSVHSDVSGWDVPFQRVFGMTETEIWNRGFAGGGDPGVLDRLREARDALRHHFVPAAVEEAARLVAASGAHHVVSTLPGYPLLAQIASADVPLTFLHADFGVNGALAGEEARRAPPPFRMLDPGRVTIGLSSAHPEPALDAMRASLGPRFDRLVHVVGYPVQRAFSPPVTGAEIDRLRADLGVSAGEQVVLLMMGWSGNGDRLIHLSRLLFEHPPGPAPRLHVVVVCGRSEGSRRAIEGLLSGASPRIRARVTGALRAEEIAGYMHLAAVRGPARGGVVVTKPGGATTGECAAAGAHMLLFPGFPWEHKNRSFAIAGGFGEACSEDTFLPALARSLAEAPAPHVPPIDWRARLLAHLRRKRP